jgi:tartrate dehydrogenase/decarboxylase / D-malate dehydrogenase
MESAKALRRHRICVIPGDGIGPEVIAQGLRALENACAARAVTLDIEEHAWGADYYARYGRMMPANALSVVEGFDAIYFGAVGSPEVADHVTVWGLLMPIRKHLDLFVNVRPIRSFAGVKARHDGSPQNVDMVIIRENAEGEYANVGGRMYPGENEIAIQTSVFTRRGTSRIIDYAFRQATPQGGVQSITKSNALAYSMTMWDEVTREVSARYPDIPCERLHVDAAAYRMVIAPDTFHTVVASNLFGDILSDLGAGLLGSLGLAASANLNPDQSRGLFEPVHGSAPDIAGRGHANPLGAILSGAMMMEFLGEKQVATDLREAVSKVIAAGIGTPDIGGTCSTRELADEVLQALR